MFRKPPVLKPASPLRSSARRALVAHLQSLYPALAHATAEQVVQVVPNGLKQCGATTSGGHKAVIYTDEHGRPLWFEVGHDAGAALHQSQQQHKKQAHNGIATSAVALAEVVPTVYTLWLMPSLLPRLPTWPQIVDPTLLSGSALMVPGLVPAPHTFPTGLQWQAPSASKEEDRVDGRASKEEADEIVLPGRSALVAITAYPSPVPLVVARLEADMREIIGKRAAGEKGKAATTIHSMGDHLWEIGGKASPPNTEDIEARSQLSVSGQQELNADDGTSLAKDMASVTIATSGQTNGGCSTAASDDDLEANGATSTSETNLTPAEVDEILHLSLLASLKSIAKHSASALPMSTSAFYSSYVLPNRPSCWPPLDPKRRRRANLPSSLISTASATSAEASRPVGLEASDVRHSTCKKLSKWVKVEEKKGIFKCKDVKGKDTVIRSINTTHTDLKGLDAFHTIAQAQEEKPLTSDADTSSGGQRTEKSMQSGAGQAKPVVVIERFWRSSSSSVKLFQEMGCSTSTPLSRPVIRGRLLQYTDQKQLVDPRNQAMVRIQDPHLTHALFPKVPLNEIPVALRRDDILERLLTASCTEFHRTSRLLPKHAAKVAQLNAKGTNGTPEADADDDIAVNAEAGEVVGPMSKGAAQAVKVEVRTRQGRKVVSLITNLDVYAIDADTFAADLMRIVGASASTSALPNSTPKHPKHEVFVQGDQRNAIYELLESQHGLDRRHVQINDQTKK